jgi:hypothetical protein
MAQDQRRQTQVLPTATQQRRQSGLDDCLAAGNTVDDLWNLIKPKLPPIQEATPSTPQPPLPEPKPCTIDDAVAVFKRWLHIKDAAPILAVAATIVATVPPATQCGYSWLDRRPAPKPKSSRRPQGCPTSSKPPP